MQSPLLARVAFLLVLVAAKREEPLTSLLHFSDPHDKHGAADKREFNPHASMVQKSSPSSKDDEKGLLARLRTGIAGDCVLEFHGDVVGCNVGCNCPRFYDECGKRVVGTAITTDVGKCELAMWVYVGCAVAGLLLLAFMYRMLKKTR